ncbi:cytochrome P450 family protein [Streptomyces chartreusis]|uniref:hypothetical protein n=1 Tax=Streptomyces chartreusis TaxID=1969 RepID=UPI0036A12A81
MVLSDSIRFSSDIPMPDAPSSLRMFIQTDPPEHSRIRQILTPYFTVKRTAAYRNEIDHVVQEAIHSLSAENRTHADLIHDFTLPVAYAAVCGYIGVPVAGRLTVDHWLHVFQDAASSHSDKQQAVTELMDYLDDIVTSKGMNGDDVLTH